jgi:hypothetical protein
VLLHVTLLEEVLHYHLRNPRRAPVRKLPESGEGFYEIGGKDQIPETESGEKDFTEGSGVEYAASIVHPLKCSDRAS